MQLTRDDFKRALTLVRRGIPVTLLQEGEDPKEITEARGVLLMVDTEFSINCPGPDQTIHGASFEFPACDIATDPDALVWELPEEDLARLRELNRAARDFAFEKGVPFMVVAAPSRTEEGEFVDRHGCHYTASAAVSRAKDACQPRSLGGGFEAMIKALMA